MKARDRRGTVIHEQLLGYYSSKPKPRIAMNETQSENGCNISRKDSCFLLNHAFANEACAVSRELSCNAPAWLRFTLIGFYSAIFVTLYVPR